MTHWGPHNPHPLSRIKTELVWEGKYDEYGNRRPVRPPASPLPLQRIETIDQPRVNEFRNTRVAHVETPLTDEREAWDAMHAWLTCLNIMAGLGE